MTPMTALERQSISHTERASMTDAAPLFEHGFMDLQNFVSADDVVAIRSILEPMMDYPEKHGLTVQDLGDARTGGKGIVELERVAGLEPLLMASAFFGKALSWSSMALGEPAQYLFDHVIDKPPRSEQPTAWHQDCAYSRLTRSSRRIHWWLPLQAVNEDNGCLMFVKGSHRGAVLPHRRRTPGGPLHTEAPILSSVIAAPLQMGDVSLHLPKTLHSAGPNHTDQRRIAWVIHFGVKTWRPQRI